MYLSVFLVDSLSLSQNQVVRGNGCRKGYVEMEKGMGKEGQWRDESHQEMSVTRVE